MSLAAGIVIGGIVALIFYFIAISLVTGPHVAAIAGLLAILLWFLLAIVIHRELRSRGGVKL